MGTKRSTIFVLGNGPVANAISLLFSLELIEHEKDLPDWQWKRRSELESAKLILVAEANVDESRWIRWHMEARKCPFARRVGVLLFGMGGEDAIRLAERDVFGRIGADCASFREWGPDLVLVDNARPLLELLRFIADLKTLPESSWMRHLQVASCLPSLTDAIRNRKLEDLVKCLEPANATDWDAACFSSPQFGDAHAWANRIRSWLTGVTVGVTPDWEEGFLLFTPLSVNQSPN
jgi:hypothetical protein